MTMATAQNQVVTPEAVPLELETANIGSRGLAVMIDWLIQGATLFALLVGLTALIGATNAHVGVGIAAASFFLLTFIALWGYPTVMETLWRGRTIGKAALGLRVITVEGAPVRFRHAAIRATLGLVDFILTSGGSHDLRAPDAAAASVSVTSWPARSCCASAPVCARPSPSSSPCRRGSRRTRRRSTWRA